MRKEGSMVACDVVVVEEEEEEEEEEDEKRRDGTRVEVDVFCLYPDIITCGMWRRCYCLPLCTSWPLRGPPSAATARLPHPQTTCRSTPPLSSLVFEC
jgi:hypothetical protein